MMPFSELIRNATARNKSHLCVGLDPDPEKFPDHLSKDINGARTFVESIIDSTSDLVCCYKPNCGFFEQFGWEGVQMLEELRSMIPAHIPMLLDAKRSDIGNTATAYAKSAFDVIRADAITVNPLLGRDSIEPFTIYKSKGVFLLALTSNPGAADFQLPNDLHYQVCDFASSMATNCPEVALVAGATRPDDLREIRERFPNGLILVPGVGSQGGELEETIKAGSRHDDLGLIINVSRAVLYASSGKDFAEAARDAASHFREQINNAISATA